MLKVIEFKANRFETKEDNNLLNPLTENTIILCNNYKLMDSLSKEIINTVNGDTEYNDYDCDDEDVGRAKCILNFGLQRLIDINGQRITLALESSIVYKAKRIEDIWFYDCNGDPDGTKHKECIYPMTIFKGSKEVWKSGLDEVYKVICNGCYGTYDGKWINLDVETETDHRTSNCSGQFPS